MTKNTEAKPAAKITKAGILPRFRKRKRKEVNQRIAFARRAAELADMVAEDGDVAATFKAKLLKAAETEGGFRGVLKGLFLKFLEKFADKLFDSLFDAIT